MPSQSQVKWAQLRVGLTVVFAAAVLAVLIFLMTGSGSFFHKKVTLKSYFDNAGGLRVGATVSLQGVDIGNVSAVRVVPDHGLTPVEIDMKIDGDAAKEIPKDSVASMSTVGVLGETFIDIDRTQAKSTQTVREGDQLPIRDNPQIQDVVRASQGTIQNLDVLVRRLDRIVNFVESGQGSIGKLIYDESLYKQLNSTLGEIQGIANDISSGKGSIGKLLVSDELYNKANTSVDKLNQIIDEINAGNGTVGKLLKDPSLYNNANNTIAKANRMIEDINAGKGAIGKLTKDEAFAQKLDNTVSKLSNVMDRLDKGEGSAGMLLRDPSLFVNADQMLVEARHLLVAVRTDPKKYLSIRLKIF